MKRILSIYLVLTCFACRSRQDKPPENYSAGFQTIHLVDSTRIYKPGASPGDSLQFRPIDLDLWYPAKLQPRDTAIIFRQLIGLLDQRANFYTASNAGDGLSEQLAGLFCEGFHCSTPLQLLNSKTSSFANAAAVPGKFPLVVYFSAYNGMSYENFTLFESLAKQGLYVVCISSIGRYPGDMTMKTADLLEQVNDAVFAVTQLKGNPSIDCSRIGVVGYSWGGLAASIFATTVPGIDCIVSLEGSEFHHYGSSAEEDREFDSTRFNPIFRDFQPRQSYLRLQTTQAEQRKAADSIFNFSSKISGKSEIISIKNARHEDFGCLAQVVPESGNCADSGLYRSISTRTVSFLTTQLFDPK